MKCFLDGPVFGPRRAFGGKLRDLVFAQRHAQCRDQLVVAPLLRRSALVTVVGKPAVDVAQQPRSAQFIARKRRKEAQMLDGHRYEEFESALSCYAQTLASRLPRVVARATKSSTAANSTTFDALRSVIACGTLSDGIRTGSSSAISRRGHDPQVERGAQERRCNWSDGVDDVFAVIQNQQQLLTFEPRRNRLVDAVSFLLAYPERLSDHAGNELGIGNRRQVHKPDTVGIVFEKLQADLHCQPRLADTARRATL